MSLYGLDIAHGKKGGMFLFEINGVNSGMNGFARIYGDRRVEQKVYEMLAEGGKPLSINNGTYTHQQFCRNHPMWAIFIKMIKGTSMFQDYYREAVFPTFLRASNKAQVEWLEEARKVFRGHGRTKYPFPVYKGQDSLVINWHNEQLPHETVNSFVAEEITRNKFLQYIALKDTEIGRFLAETTLVGLGTTDKKKLEEILNSSEEVIVKPLSSARGVGFKVLTKEEAEQFKKTRGPVDYADVVDSLRETTPPYVEDLVASHDFSFEYGVSVLQPFIETASVEDMPGSYTSIRAIVCNGKFVDAYIRASTKPRVNLGMGAEAFPIDDSELAEFCEQVVEVFEGECAKLTSADFQSKLYNKYFDERGRTTIHERRTDSFAPLAGAIMSMARIR